MVNGNVIRLWLISLLVCYTAVSCQDIEPNTLEPEISEATTVGAVSTTDATMIETTSEISGVTTDPSSTSGSNEKGTTTEVTTPTIDENEITSKRIEDTTSVADTTTTTRPESTTEKDMTTATTKPPCPQPSCYYKLTHTRVYWFFSKVCCFQCCYLKDLPYEKCRAVHPEICGYPSGIGYYFYEDHVDYKDSSYSYY